MIRAPYGGLPSRVDWWEYSNLFADESSIEFEWMFGARWSPIDNTPHGAAARIRYVLDHGAAPPGYERPDKGTALWLSRYAPYRIGAKALADG
jgi:hypothetical protein